MLVPRQEYSRELKMAAMREIDSGKGMTELARMYQLSPKRLETWKGEWRAKGELAFPGKSARPQTSLGGPQWFEEDFEGEEGSDEESSAKGNEEANEEEIEEAKERDK
jgi:transposase